MPSDDPHALRAPLLARLDELGAQPVLVIAASSGRVHVLSPRTEDDPWLLACLLRLALAALEGQR